MTTTLRIGSGTHTGHLIGYCPICGLHHDSPAVEAFCLELRAARTPEQELGAWRTLLAAGVKP